MSELPPSPPEEPESLEHRLGRLAHEIQELHDQGVIGARLIPPPDPNDDYWKTVPRRPKARPIMTVRPNPEYL